VVPGVHTVPFQCIPHILPHLHSWPLHAWFAAFQGWQPAQVQATSDLDGLEHWYWHLGGLAYLLQCWQVMQVNGGQPRELDTCLALFFQYKDVPEVTTMRDVEGLQAREGGAKHWDCKAEAGARAPMKLPQATEVPKPMQTLAPDAVGL
jgi:hypothetical protein